MNAAQMPCPNCGYTTPDARRKARHVARRDHEATLRSAIRRAAATHQFAHADDFEAFVQSARAIYLEFSGHKG